MSRSAELVYSPGLFNGFLLTSDAMDAQDRTQFFGGKGMFPPDAVEFHEKKVCAGRDIQADISGNFGRRASDRHGMHGTTVRVDQGCLQFFPFRRSDHVSSQGLKFGHCLLVDLIINKEGPFARTDHPVVKGLGGDDVDDGHVDVAGFVQIGGGVSAHLWGGGNEHTGLHMSTLSSMVSQSNAMTTAETRDPRESMRPAP